jgi:hypothetical protein
LWEDAWLTNCHAAEWQIRCVTGNIHCVKS